MIDTNQAPEHASDAGPARQRLLTIITPAYREEKNLPLLHSRLSAAAETYGIDIEWLIVDDHSPDATFDVAKSIALRDSRVRVMRLARNSGSHNAIFCGFVHARGDCVVLLAGDLQDPPETIAEMLHAWRDGAQVVWAVRATPPQTRASDRLFASLYYSMMQKIVGLKEMAPTGADMVLLDAVVVNGLRRFGERNLSIFALISWMGFRQASIVYTKEDRMHGTSGWTFRKKLKLAVDSITSFTFLPVRFFSAVGVVSALLGFLYAAVVVVRTIRLEVPVEGWSSLMVAVLIIGGIQLLMLGVLGEYVWRSLQEARGRPRYLVEQYFSGKDASRPPPSGRDVRSAPAVTASGVDTRGRLG